MPTKTAGRALSRPTPMNTRPATHGVIPASKESGIDMSTNGAAPGHYLIASDFDQTLSFNDSGLVLSELIGVPNFREKVDGLSDIHLVQQGAELTYLLRHDPEFRCVRREHLIETGKQVRLKKRSEEHTSELQSLAYLVCRLLLEKKNRCRTTDRLRSRQLVRKCLHCPPNSRFTQ